MQTRTVLITGSTAGLGKATALRLAPKGYRLLLHGRSEEKGAELLEELRMSGNNGEFFYYAADLASLEQVRSMAQAVLRDQTQLHVLVNNAGIGGGPQGNRNRETSAEGYELRFAVNYLSEFLLTQLLLPLLRASAPSRIVQVSSIAQEPLDFGDLMYSRDYTSYGAYSRSKLAQILFSFELAERLKDSGVTVNVLHPATLMDTRMVAEFFGRTMTSVSEGAAHLEYLIESPQLEQVSGAYLVNRRISTAHAQAYDAGARQLLWDRSMELCGLS